jgi:hypothetical protein
VKVDVTARPRRDGWRSQTRSRAPAAAAGVDARPGTVPWRPRMGLAGGRGAEPRARSTAEAAAGVGGRGARRRLGLAGGARVAGTWEEGVLGSMGIGRRQLGLVGGALVGG